MKSFLFVGERPSKRAIIMGVKWEDGRLAARQLFDALLANGLNPSNHVYTNWFQTTLGPYLPKRGIVSRIRKLSQQGYCIVALGNKVSFEMSRNGIFHIPMIHPAARGKIRKKCLYVKHVGEVLNLS